MGHSVGKMLHRERQHERSIRVLDDNDHATKRGGGTATHGTDAATFKTIETGAKDKTHTPMSAFPAVIRAATGKGAAPSGPSPSDVDGDW